jgi:hypothetical protein
MERENNLLSCDELEMISGGATKLLDINVAGARFEYYDNGTGVGTTYFGWCVTTGSGKTVCEHG